MEKADITKTFSIASRRLHAYYAKEMSAIGIKPGMLGYILCITNNPDISQDRMSEISAVEKSSTAKAVKILLAEGYVTRAVNPDDKREYILAPTAKAHAATEMIMAIKERAHLHITREMTEVERDIFLRLLAKVSLD